VSPFDEAALFSVDGFGDFASASWGIGRGNRITPMGSVTFPHSLGICYTAITQYLGFPKFGDEYKAMGLAAYGEPEFLDEFRKIVLAPDDAPMSFELDCDYFVHQRGAAKMTWAGGEPCIERIYSDHLVERLGQPRAPDEPLEEKHFAIAASMQRRLEEVILGRLQTLQRITGLRKLCMAGGVANNCVANGKIISQTGFDEVYIPPSAGDAGLAIGAALYVHHQTLGNPRTAVMDHAYWGPEFSRSDVRSALDARRDDLERQGCAVREIESEQDLCRLTASEIAGGKVVGWFQGRMEWGPRALGNRSILADPRRAEMREILNTKIKRRESFRPFAPSVAEEAAGDFFCESKASPFMLMAYSIRPTKRRVIPATTHVDGSGRVQTVNGCQNPRYYRLLKEFERLTSVPVLLNTSFNENEPVVCKPDEALDCFLRTRMDSIVLGNVVVSRAADA
jgi:carbamoyltransferase